MENPENPLANFLKVRMEMPTDFLFFFYIYIIHSFANFAYISSAEN